MLLTQVCPHVSRALRGAALFATAAIAACSDQGSFPTSPMTAPARSVATFDSLTSTTGFVMLDLGTLGGEFGQAAAVNDSGLVVGSSIPRGDFHEHAFYWTREDGMRDLGTFGKTDARLVAVNDAGVAVGYAYESAGFVTVPIIWSKSAGARQLSVPRGWTYCEAIAINRFGTVIGNCDLGYTNPGAVMWPPNGGRAVSLGGLPLTHGFVAVGVDVHTTVVGRGLYGPFSLYHWAVSTYKKLGQPVGRLFPDTPPSVDGAVPVVTAMSPLFGYVAGEVNHIDRIHGYYSQMFLWEGAGQPRILAPLGDYLEHTVSAVSERKWVVGEVSEGFTRALLWRPNHGSKRLGELGPGANSSAIGVNGKNWVVGSSTTANGERTHAVIWVVP